jgi:hypothetical protein
MNLRQVTNPMPLVFPNPAIVPLFGHSSLIVWGRLVTCGGLVIRLVLNRKIIGADCKIGLHGFHED